MLNFFPNTDENLSTASATVHNYDTRNKDILLAAHGIHIARLDLWV